MAARKPPVTRKMDPNAQADPSKCKSAESRNGQHQWQGGHHESKVHRYECKNKDCGAVGHFDVGSGSIQLGAAKNVPEAEDDE